MVASDRSPFEQALEAIVDRFPVDFERLEREGNCSKEQIEILRMFTCDQEEDGVGEIEESDDFEQLEADPDLPFSKVGEFELKRVLGRGKGGMGQVFLAVDVRSGFNKKVALKIPRLPDSDIVRDRFIEEIRVLSKLEFHPNVVPVLACDEHDGLPFFVMEYIPGRDLEDEIRKATAEARRIPTAKALAWARQVASGLEYLHKNCLIHLDVKPANVRITPEDNAVLVDFGVVRDLSRQRARTAQVGAFTALYASPEQVDPSCNNIDERTDVWSLGVTLFEMMTGRHPFGGETDTQIIKNILEKPLVSPRKLNHKLSKGTATVVLGALEKYPGRRYQSIAFFGSDIDRVRNGEDPLFRRPSILMRAWRRFIRNTLALSLSAVVLLGLLCLLYWRASVAWEAKGIRVDLLTRCERSVEAAPEAAIGAFIDLLDDHRGSSEARRAREIVEERISKTWSRLEDLAVGETGEEEGKLLEKLLSHPEVLKPTFGEPVWAGVEHLAAFWRVRTAYDRFKEAYKEGAEKCDRLKAAREKRLHGAAEQEQSQEERARTELWELNVLLSNVADELHRACINAEDKLPQLHDQQYRRTLAQHYGELRQEFADLEKKSAWRWNGSVGSDHLGTIARRYGHQDFEGFSVWVQCTPSAEEAYLFKYLPYKDELSRLVPFPMKWDVGENSVVGLEDGEDQADIFWPGFPCVEIVKVENPRGVEPCIRKGDLIVKIGGVWAVPGLFAGEVEKNHAADENGVRPFDKIEYFGDREIEDFYDLKVSDSLDQSCYKVIVAGGDRTEDVKFVVPGYRENWPMTPSEVLEELTGISAVNAATLVCDCDPPEEGVSMTIIRGGRCQDVHLYPADKIAIKAKITAYPLIFTPDGSRVCEDEVFANSWQMTDLEEGSYLLVLRRSGYQDLRIPFETPWILGEGEPAAHMEDKHPVIKAALIREEDAIPGFIWVPGGPFKSAGDPEPYLGWTASETKNVDMGFWIARYEVTLGEWLKFINDGEQLKLADKAIESGFKPGLKANDELNNLHLLSYYSYPLGYFKRCGYGYYPIEEGWDKGVPAWGVRGNSPQAFVNWMNRKAVAAATAANEERRIEYYLPDCDQWEKAASGVDGRLYPWGWAFGWSFCKGRFTRPLREPGDLLLPEAVGTILYDESVYGVRDMGGSVKEWARRSESEWVGKGGSWADGNERSFRCAFELPVPRDYVDHKMGLRLCARWTYTQSERTER